jgi:hypothetical protein
MQISLWQEIKTQANTDNKGKLFVMVFAFTPATKTTFRPLRKLVPPSLVSLARGAARHA